MFLGMYGNMCFGYVGDLFVDVRIILLIMWWFDFVVYSEL